MGAISSAYNVKEDYGQEVYITPADNSQGNPARSALCGGLSHLSWPQVVIVDPICYI